MPAYFILIPNIFAPRIPPRAKPDEDRYKNEKATYRAPDQSRRKRSRTGYNVFFSEYVYRLKTHEGGMPPERGMTARIVGEAWKKMSDVEKDKYEREACGIYGDSDHVGGGGGEGGGFPRYLHHPPSRLELLGVEGCHASASGRESTMASPSVRDDNKLRPSDDGDGGNHHPPEGSDPDCMPYPPPPDVYGGGYGNLLGTAPLGGQPPAIIHQVGEGGYDPYAYGPGMMPPNPYDHMYGGYPPPYPMPPPGMLIPPMYGHHPPPSYQLPPPHHHHPTYNPTYDEGG
jgi:hypothetical protein